MERLTNKREADAQREEYERRLANGYPRNIPEERFLRLAAYEDTHMMPSDVTSMRMDMAIIAALFNGVDVDRMKELAEVDKDGRLVVAILAELDAEIQTLSDRVTKAREDLANVYTVDDVKRFDGNHDLEKGLKHIQLF